MQAEFHYFQEIEAEFSRCRGRGVFVSPRDWQLMETWNEKQIPLHIITGTIKDVFKTKERVTSLAYCAPAVEERFKLWQDSQVGKASSDDTAACPTCFDTGFVLVPVPADRQLFSFEMENILCPECAPSA